MELQSKIIIIWIKIDYNIPKISSWKIQSQVSTRIMSNATQHSWVSPIVELSTRANPPHSASPSQQWSMQKASAHVG